MDEIALYYTTMALCDYGCNSRCGINTSCVSQIPPSEVIIHPPPFSITIPGPILSASPEPVAVTANNPCATPGCYEPGGYDYGYGSRRGGCNSGCSYPYGRYGYKGGC
uniref:Uncharacterized protein n=1 Tax=Sphaerodactylus townsendi TaxID=933632 RepID=A0ACB8G807_9SAUR